MDPVVVMRAAHTVRDELDHLLGGASGELRERLDPLLAEEGEQDPGPLADAVVMLIAQYGPAWERFTQVRHLNGQAAAEDQPAPAPPGQAPLPPGQAPLPPEPDRGPSLLNRLTGAFRRRRGQPDPGGPEWEAFPLIEAPGEVVTGWSAEVEVGLCPAPSPESGGPPGSGERQVPFPHEPADLDIQLIAEGFEAPGGWRVRLRVDGASPYPKATVRLVALPQDQPVTARQIQAVHAVRGQVTGFGVRALAVLDSPGMLGREVVAQPVAGTRVRVADAGGPADVTAVIVHGDQPGRLWWTYQSPHFTTPDQAETCDLGMRTSEFGRHVAEQAQSVEDMGRQIAAKMPRGFWELLHAVAGRVAPRRPSVLILSQEPHIPWELATLEQPLNPAVPALLNCQTATGRWPLGGRRPELPPPTRARGDSMAVVYGGAEAHPLITAYGATRVTPVLGDVLAMLGDPPDVIHFASGSSAPEALGRGMAGGPFVFLEEPGDCQAFLLAGASGVVAPLWPVADGLAPEFYRRCLGGEPVAEVLRSLRCQVPATGAAYQFFGHPSLILSRGHSAA
ncbi:hypothetical protein FHR32_008273 [Streptosporangium album]|uniref:CHAT domain-containing protein n=1 Tax=Streptosporangium album TaxID=47479 RepID=A0A7W7WDM6_9ACTN|nr:hypothetical protein [Streptosporangium album]MBB4943872.1 hypothetical protein [Streptosporangium album]